MVQYRLTFVKVRCSHLGCLSLDPKGGPSNSRKDISERVLVLARALSFT
jgi:hypothetical protein